MPNLPSRNEEKIKKSRKKLWIILGIIGAVLLCLIIGVVVIVILSSNYSSYDNNYKSYGGNYAGSSLSKSKSAVPEVAEESNDAKVYEKTATGPDSDSVEGELVEQKVIKIGNVTLRVKKADNSITELTNLAESKGGFVLSSSLYTASDETQSGAVTLKVPVSKYKETMNEIKNLGDVQRESSTGQDVTEKYSDLQAQLKNYKAEEEQYLKILEKANTVEDILKVTKQLSSVRENIEVTEGRIKYLESQTDMSTINVSLSEETKIDVPTKEWKPLETLKKAFRTWIQFLQGLVNVVIWAVIFLGPVTLIMYVIIKLITRKIRKKKSESK